AIKDPELRRKVTPRDEVGCKRIMLTDDWYPTLTKPNVSLVDDRIEAILPHAIKTAGQTREADVLVLATGFDAHEFVAPMEIEGTEEAAVAFDQDLRAALAKTVWHSGCTNWYVDEHGNDPSQWPWSWSEYRRRTERLDPKAYVLA